MAGKTHIDTMEFVEKQLEENIGTILTPENLAEHDRLNKWFLEELQKIDKKNLSSNKKFETQTELIYKLSNLDPTSGLANITIQTYRSRMKNQ